MTTTRKVCICKICKKTVILPCNCPLHDTDVVITLQKSGNPHENDGKNVENITKWQPIETAPKDGTFIDVWCGHAQTPYREACVFWGKRYSDDKEGFYYREGYFLEGDDEPTHWMPLHAPPEVKE